MTDLIDNRSIAWWGNRLAGLVCRLDPCCFGALDFSQRFFRRGSKGRTGIKIGNVGNKTAVFLAVENIDVVILLDP